MHFKMKILFHLNMAAMLKSGKITSIMNFQVNMVCLIGKLTGGSCGNRVKRKLEEEMSGSLQLFQIDKLGADLSHHFRKTQQVCQNVTCFVPQSRYLRQVNFTSFVGSIKTIMAQNLGSDHLSVCTLVTLNLKES